jgi:thiosulfate dehydrogenase
VPPTPTPAPKVDLTSVARGGLLYDKWWEVVAGASEPKDNQALWALQTTNTRTGADTWRCKECHGWDYKGKDGAYGKGSHMTGFPGVWDAAQKKTVQELTTILGGSANAKHNFTTVLKPADVTDLANFLKYGLVDVSKYVDYTTKKPIGGDAARGKSLYDGLCAACHGPDGKKLNFGTDKEPEYVGTLAKDNPFEFLHKARAGQPGSDPTMPSTLVLGWNIQQVVDLLAYAQTLPEK